MVVDLYYAIGDVVMVGPSYKPPKKYNKDRYYNDPPEPISCDDVFVSYSLGLYNRGHKLVCCHRGKY